MQAPQEADIFLIPLLNGDHAVGQVVEVEKAPENAVLCLLTLMQLQPGDTPSRLALSELISLVLLQPDHLTSGTWLIIGFETLPNIQEVFQLERAKNNRFADIQIHDPAIIEAFINACHGHYPWDAFPDPAFFDTLLVSKTARPATARMQAEFQG